MIGHRESNTSTSHWTHPNSAYRIDMNAIIWLLRHWQLKRFKSSDRRAPSRTNLVWQ